MHSENRLGEFSFHCTFKIPLKVQQTTNFPGHLLLRLLKPLTPKKDCESRRATTG